MSQPLAIRRYSIIVHSLKNGSYPTLSQLCSRLQQRDLDVSERTIQRDLENLRHTFGLAIAYDASRKGYFLNVEESVNLDSTEAFLEVAETADILKQSLSKEREVFQAVSLEHDGVLKGIDNLPLILKAIFNKHYILFRHTSFQSGKSLPYQVNPRLLKQYKGRWYIFGQLAGKDLHLSFGLDRIENLETGDAVSPEDIRLAKAVNPLNHFKHVIGITTSVGEPEEIILSFTPEQGQYIKALPLHHSQQILEDSPQELRIRLYLINNFELRQTLLMQGSMVRVIKPLTLQKELQEIYQKALSNYK